MVRDVRLSALGIAVLCLVTGRAVQSTPPVSYESNPEDLKLEGRKELRLAFSLFHFSAAWLRPSQVNMVSCDIQGIVMCACVHGTERSHHNLKHWRQGGKMCWWCRLPREIRRRISK